MKTRAQVNDEKLEDQRQAMAMDMRRRTVVTADSRW
jgi:hypothetical protein